MRTGITLTTLLIAISAIAADNRQTEARDSYVSNIVPELVAFTPLTNSPTPELTEPGYIAETYEGRSITYGIPGNEGRCLLRFTDGWLFIITHSAHLDKGTNGIGDISLAVDDRGRLYRNTGHVCGGTRFQSTNDAHDAESASDFIARFKSCNGDKWEFMDKGKTDPVQPRH